MRTIDIRAGVLSTLVPVPLCGQASAAPIYELTLTGTVSDVDAIPSLQTDFDNTFAINDPFTFVMVYDGGAPVTEGASNIDEYGDASGDIRLTNSSSFNSVSGDHFQISIDAAVDNSPLGPDVGTAFPYAFGLVLSDTSNGIFPGAGDPPPLSTDFDFNSFDAVALSFFLFLDPVTGDDGAGDVNFNVTGLSSRIVPEPASLGVLGIGLLALTPSRRHR